MFFYGGEKNKKANAIHYQLISLQDKKINPFFPTFESALNRYQVFFLGGVLWGGGSGKQSQMLLHVESFTIFIPPIINRDKRKTNIVLVYLWMQFSGNLFYFVNDAKSKIQQFHSEMLITDKSFFMMVFVWLKQHAHQVIGYTFLAEALLSFPTFLRIQEYPSRGFTAIKLVWHETNVT